MPLINTQNAIKVVEQFQKGCRLPALFKRHTDDRAALFCWLCIRLVHARYIGVRKRLYGKMALVQIPAWQHSKLDGLEPAPCVLAQFDDTTQPDAFGWSVFPASDFEGLNA